MADGGSKLVEGGNVLRHVKRRWNCPGGGNVRRGYVRGMCIVSEGIFASRLID